MSVPNPATTEWVPLQGTRLDGMTYWGTYEASRTYNDGDCAIGPDGVLYMCVKDGTVGTVPVKWPGQTASQGPKGADGAQGIQGVGVPMPVVNGQWIKGSGGAAVWSAIDYLDVANGIKGISGNRIRFSWENGRFHYYVDGSYIGALGFADTGWITMSLISGSHYGAPYGPVQYRKLPSGMVVCQGLITIAVAGATVFNFPAGYRAAAGRDLIFTTSASVQANESWRLDANGSLRPTAVYTAGAWVSMAGISFYGE